ncbi:MAG: class I SAM-dependent methyltransferase [Deltaproteobacteria bacterium]|nr:class I SAM-dependent methyltransferase [Deltaproteobacteria bacterium]
MEEIKLGDLPFYWRLANINEKKNNPVKSFFPFSFSFDHTVDLLIQKQNEEVMRALSNIYTQNENIGYLQDDNEIAKPYGTDFIKYVENIINTNPNINKILEVGCGGCVVLSHLKKLGYEASGIDASPFAATEGKKKGIEVITDFFPSQKLKEKFGLIYHVDVLEHIRNPVEFLKNHHDNLLEDGIIIVNVPDATESIEIGDISMAMHQHINYFTEFSLRNTLTSAGFDVIDVKKAGYGGSLYGVGIRTRNPGAIVLSNEKSNNHPFKEFAKKANHSIQRFREINNAFFADENNTIGYYVPLRALPYIAACQIGYKFRFFDDTEHWHNKEFDGVSVKVENFSDLKANPVSHILIMSLTFGEVIKKKIISEFGESIKVITLSELIG